jgi:hypothetical protein
VSAETAAQLRDELGAAAHAIGVLVGESIEWERAVRMRCDLLAQNLCSDDDRLLAQTVIDVMCALWGRCDPPPEWWRTPVGRRCAHSFGHDDTAESVTHSVAAAMLGVTRGTVARLVDRGTLERAPDGGGVMVASVYQRIGRPPPS